jgi:hypothetical protein
VVRSLFGKFHAVGKRGNHQSLRAVYYINREIICPLLRQGVMKMGKRGAKAKILAVILAAVLAPCFVRDIETGVKAVLPESTAEIVRAGGSLLFAQDREETGMKIASAKIEMVGSGHTWDVPKECLADTEKKILCNKEIRNLITRAQKNAAWDAPPLNCLPTYKLGIGVKQDLKIGLWVWVYSGNDKVDVFVDYGNRKASAFGRMSDKAGSETKKFLEELYKKAARAKNAGGGPTVNGLQVFIKPDKKIYRPGEDIILEARFRNVGKGEFCFFNYLTHAISCRIVDSEGREVARKLRRAEILWASPKREDFVVLKPGKEVTEKVKNFTRKNRLVYYELEQGKYKVTMVYEPSRANKYADKFGLKDVWTGKITSNTVTVEIGDKPAEKPESPKPLSKEEIALLKKAQNVVIGTSDGLPMESFPPQGSIVVHEVLKGELKAGQKVSVSGARNYSGRYHPGKKALWLLGGRGGIMVMWPNATDQAEWQRVKDYFKSGGKKKSRLKNEDTAGGQKQ